MPFDKKRYPSNWDSEIVPKMHMRAQSKCEKCGLLHHSKINSVQFNGMTNRVWLDDSAYLRHLHVISDYKEVKVVLTVAHLDHDETNHKVKLSRLALWCQVCHLSYDQQEKLRRRQTKAEDQRELNI